MSFLWTNPLANMYGPYFLIFYSCAIVLTVLCSCVFVRVQDQSLCLPRMLVPVSPDPLEIAYLRQGLNEMLRVALYRLVKLGYVVQPPASVKNNDKMLRTYLATEKIAGAAKLSILERTLFDSIGMGVEVSSIFHKPTQNVIKIADGINSNLVCEELITGEQAKVSAAKIRLGAVSIIIGLGGYKLFAAMVTGHYNVFWLLMLTLFGASLAIWVIKPRRITNRGAAYLHSCQQAYSGLRTELNRVSTGPDLDRIVVGVAAFGFKALAGTPDARLAKLLRYKSASSDSQSRSGYEDGILHSGSSCGGSGHVGGGCGGCGSR